MSELLDQLRNATRMRHYSRRTEEAYVRWTYRFVRFHGTRHPRELAEPEVRAFLSHLASKMDVAAATQNQALAALLFLYRHVLGRELDDLGEVVRAKRPVRLPVVLTREEVVMQCEKRGGSNAITTGGDYRTERPGESLLSTERLKNETLVSPTDVGLVVDRDESAPIRAPLLVRSRDPGGDTLPRRSAPSAG